MILSKQARETLKLNQRKAASPDWKSLLDLADSIKIQLAEHNFNIANMSEKQLEDQIQTALDGGSILSEHLPIKASGVRSWLLAERLRITIAILAIATSTIEHYTRRFSRGILLGEAAPLGIFVPLYAAICLSVVLATGATWKHRIGLFVFACGLCVPLFFIGVVGRDCMLPGVCVGLCLAYAFGSTKGSCFALFLMPFLVNYVSFFVIVFTYMEYEVNWNWILNDGKIGLWS